MGNKFAAVLDMKPEDVKKVLPIPTGIYIGKIAKPHETGEVKSDKGEWETVTFNVQVVAPVLVDEEDLANYPGDVTKATLRLQFMFDQNDEVAFDSSMNRLKRCLSEHIGCWQEGEPLKKGLADAVNQEIQFEVSHRQNKNDQEEFFAEIKRTMPVE